MYTIYTTYTHFTAVIVTNNSIRINTQCAERIHFVTDSPPMGYNCSYVGTCIGERGRGLE